jgi:hypothetical protein
MATAMALPQPWAALAMSVLVAWCTSPAHGQANATLHVAAVYAGAGGVLHTTAGLVVPSLVFADVLPSAAASAAAAGPAARCSLKLQSNGQLNASCPVAVVGAAVNGSLQLRPANTTGGCSPPVVTQRNGTLYICAKTVRFEGGLYVVPPSSPALRWVAGGDPGQAWTATASSQYQGCSLFNLCNPQYAVDGQSDPPTVGNVLDLQGPGNQPRPQTVVITFEASKRLYGWRVWVPVCSYRLRNAELQYTATKGSSTFSTVESSRLESPVPVSQGGTSPYTVLNATWAQPVAVAAVRIVITSMHDCPQNPASVFQLYMAEVQFLEAV